MAWNTWTHTRAGTLRDGALVEGYLHEPGGTCPLLRQDETGVHYILPDQNDGPSEEVDGAAARLGGKPRRARGPRGGCSTATPAASRSWANGSTRRAGCIKIASGTTIRIQGGISALSDPLI